MKQKIFLFFLLVGIGNSILAQQTASDKELLQSYAFAVLNGKKVEIVLEHWTLSKDFSASGWMKVRENGDTLHSSSVFKETRTLPKVQNFDELADYIRDFWHIDDDFLDVSISIQVNENIRVDLDVTASGYSVDIFVEESVGTAEMRRAYYWSGDGDTERVLESGTWEFRGARGVEYENGKYSYPNEPTIKVDQQQAQDAMAWYLRQLRVVIGL